jgi:PAS domain S-box-containing protein
LNWTNSGSIAVSKTAHSSATWFNTVPAAAPPASLRLMYCSIPFHPPRWHHQSIQKFNPGSSALAARFTRPAQQHANRAPGGVRAHGPDDGYADVFWTAFRRSANAMVVVDLDRRIVAVNDAGTALAGRSANALTGERIATLLDDPAEAPDDAVWRAQVLQGESFGRRRIRRPDGSTRVIDFAMRATRVGTTVLVLAVCLRDRAGGRSGPAHVPAPLTGREQEIVGRIALGEVTPEICAALHIAPDTVRTHVRNAMAKTGARTRAQLIAIALTEGLLDA